MRSERSERARGLFKHLRLSGKFTGKESVATRGVLRVPYRRLDRSLRRRPVASAVEGLWNKRGQRGGDQRSRKGKRHAECSNRCRHVSRQIAGNN